MANAGRHTNLTGRDLTIINNYGPHDEWLRSRHLEGWVGRLTGDVRDVLAGTKNIPDPR